MSRILVEGVSKRYGGTDVLHEIQLCVPDAAVLALLGPSGCGKTTLLRLIAGFDPLDRGRITFDERVVASSSVCLAPEHRGIGYVPQEGALFPHLTVEGNVGFGLPRDTRRASRVAEVLELTGLTGLGRRFPHELSGGQQQRVALARALAPGPSLVLLDEPFNALDLDLRRSMCEDVVAVLRETGTTTILVTHDPGEAFAISDHLAVMQAGEIMQYGSPEEVYWQPATPAVARLTGPVIFLTGELGEGGAETSLGCLEVHAMPSFQDSPAWIMLRPEQLRLADADAGGVEARVVRRSFRGDHTMLELMLGDELIAMRVPSLSAPLRGALVVLSVEGPAVVFTESAREATRDTHVSRAAPVSPDPRLPARLKRA